MDLGLRERVYVVTGGSRGLGFATAQCLVADGARVVISARDPDRVADAVRRLGGPVHAAGAVGDLADDRLPMHLVDRAVDCFGTVHGALVSVGAPPRGSAPVITDAQWRAAFDTVFLGSVRLARTVAARLEPGGAIGFVLSSSARSPIPGLAISNALRPALAGIAKDLADEYGPHGVRVFGLLPHHILTDRNQALLAASSDPRGARHELEVRIPLRRLGEPAEFGRAAAFLLSPAASYLTGLTLPIDGGAVRTL